MFPRHRRLLAAVVALSVIALTVAAVRQNDPPRHTFRVVFGLKDKEPGDWSGQVSVAGGEVAALSGWRFEGKEDSVEGTTAWKCRTRDGIAPEQRYAIQGPDGTPKSKAVEVPWPNGIHLTVQGATPTVTLKLARGTIKFSAADVLLGEPRTFLDGQVRVERVPAVSTPRSAAPPKAAKPVQDDYPAFWVRYRTGKHYLAWVAYQNERDRVLLAERDGPDGKWSEPVEVAGPGQHFRVALATLHDDTLWIVWASQRSGNWDLFGRPYLDGKLGVVVRLTDDAGPDLWHRMTTDNRGRAWLVWQGFRGGRSAIFARWHEPIQVSADKGNAWDPTVAADSKEDRVWVGWDAYERDTYNVRVRALSGGPKPRLGEVLFPEPSPLFAAHVSLACDRAGRLWAAWDESGPQWGKDTGFLYGGQHRTDTTRLYAARAVRTPASAWARPVSAASN